MEANTLSRAVAEFVAAMLVRVLETEAMDTAAEAVDYDSMDHRDVNRVFVTDLLAARGEEGDWGLGIGDWKSTATGPRSLIPSPQSPIPCFKGCILDLGTGTAQIPIELCRQHPRARVLAIDVARHMLLLAQKNIEQAGLADRIRVECVDAKRLPYADGAFDTVASNSIVHHIPEPGQALAEAWRVLAPGGLIFIRDLVRPDDEAAVRRLVETYAAGANAHQQQMLADSFHAALTLDEVRRIVTRFGTPAECVRATSDRHWTWAARKSGG
jgi:ubiquinone/menaquinone biosynthesis C-methylase UbiE